MKRKSLSESRESASLRVTPNGCFILGYQSGYDSGPGPDLGMVYIPKGVELDFRDANGKLPTMKPKYDWESSYLDQHGWYFDPDDYPEADPDDPRIPKQLLVDVVSFRMGMLSWKELFNKPYWHGVPINE